MNKSIPTLVILALALSAPALAQIRVVTPTGDSPSVFSLRSFGGLGVGFGSINAELEWLDLFTTVYPRGSLAYTFGVGGTAGAGLGAFSVHGGAILYSGSNRDGFFGAARMGGGIVADTQTRVGTFYGTSTLTGGYRWATGPVELGLEGGLYLASVDIDSNRSAVLLSPVLLLSAGFRF